MINIFHKLNGWQRLWLLASVAWLLLVGYYAFENYPGARVTFEYVGKAGCFFTDLYGKDAKRAIEKVLPELASFEKGAPESCKELFEKIAQSGRTDEVKRVYEQYLQESRLTFFSRAVVYWAIPVVITYLLGIGIAWVIRGFRRSA